MYNADRSVRPYRLYGVADHVTALIAFGHDPIGLQPIKHIKCRSRPGAWRITAALVFDNISAVVDTKPGTNDAREIARGILRDGRIDSHNNSFHIRRLVIVKQRLVNHLTCPKGAFDLFKYLAVELLTTETRAFVLLDNDLDKRAGQIGPIS